MYKYSDLDVAASSVFAFVLVAITKGNIELSVFEFSAAIFQLTLLILAAIWAVKFYENSK